MKNQCPFPFPGCPGASCTWNGLHYHFKKQNWGDWISILDKHPNPLPRCKFYGSQVPVGRLSNRHYTSEKCKQGEERRLMRKTLQRCFEASRFLFQINAKTLPLLEVLPYLRRTITYNNSSWETVYLNLWKARRRWGMIARVL